MNRGHPSRRLSPGLIRRFFALGLLLYLQFFLVYGLGNWLAAQRGERFRLYLEWELAIPLVPQFIYIYLSLSLFAILPVAYLQPRQLKPWALSFMWMTFIAGCVFILLPTEQAAPRPPELSDSHALFAILYALDRPHNLFPSLHVAYSTLTLLIIIGSRYRDNWIWPIAGWWLLMLISVLLVHQHYLLDIAGGLVLASLCYKFIYLTVARQSGSGDNDERSGIL